MTKPRILFAALALAVISVGFSIESEPAADPHAAPRTGVSGVEASAFAAAYSEAAAQAAWIEGENLARWYEGVAEAQAVADLARQRPVRSPVGGHVSGDCAALAAELGLPESVLWRESRCSTDAYNATGCGGRGCLGAAQVDAGHFDDVSPWNSKASGACADLDANDPAQYAECVHRLSGGGSNLSPWGA